MSTLNRRYALKRNDTGEFVSWSASYSVSWDHINFAKTWGSRSLVTALKNKLRRTLELENAREATPRTEEEAAWRRAYIEGIEAAINGQIVVVSTERREVGE